MIGLDGDVKGAPSLSEIEILPPPVRSKDRNKARSRARNKDRNKDKSKDRSKDLLLKACKDHFAAVEEYRTADSENRQVTHHTCIWAAGAPAFYSHEEKEK